MLNNMSLIFLCFSFLYSSSLNILFFMKKHIKTYETRLFSILMVSNLIGILLELFCIAFIKLFGTSSFATILVNKLFLIYLLAFAFLFGLYAIFITMIGQDESYSKVHNKIRYSGFALFAFGCILVLALPIHVYNKLGKMYSYGPSANVVYAFAGICVFICLISMIINFEKVKSKKTIPLVAFIIGCFAVTVIQKINPALTFATSMETFLIFLMYNTIENPDVKMIDELQVARDQAEKANRAKTDFLSSMSHEIRTPLNAIVGFSDCIMDSETLDEAKENATDIINASQTLLEIVNGILDISKIEAGKIEIVNSPYNASEIFNELAKLITPKMNEKGLDFSYNIAPDIPQTLYGDHANLKKIVTNILSNACKYTDKGFVHYEVNCVNSNNVCKLIISVEDSGRGIKQENVDKLFTKFQRLDEDRNTTIEGTGLGLAITKQLIELMGGRIIVHTVYGEGSKFTIVLNQKTLKTIPKVEKKVKSTLDLHDVRILLVDDTLLNLKVATKLLQRYNANMIDTCSSGFECIDKINKGEKYDLILLDDMMPKMSGVITLKKLKENPNFKIPTIALTANAITGMKEKYLADGFNDYLAKPIEKESLIRVVNGVLGRNATEELDKITPLKTVSVNTEDTGAALITVDSMSEFKSAIIPVTDADMNDVLPKKEQFEDTSMIEVLEEEISSYDRSYLEKNGADINHALELLGDMEMYNMTINDFVSEIDEKWGRIIEYKNTNNMSDYAIEVHSLKSDCKYLGFMGLADISYEHELKSKENDIDFVNNNFKRLEDEYNRVVEVCKKYVENNPIEEE